MLAKSSWRWLTPHGAQLCSLSDQACMRCSCIGASICRAILETHQKRLLRLGYVTFPKRGALPSGWPRFNYDGWASISPYPPGYTMMIKKRILMQQMGAKMLLQTYGMHWAARMSSCQARPRSRAQQCILMHACTKSSAYYAGCSEAGLA